jgi:hypothetical protein
MSLHYLIFDVADDGHGHLSFEAMASCSAAQWPALQAEVAQVLDWAQDQFPHSRGALDEGADWDFELQARIERTSDLGLHYQPGSGLFSSQPADDTWCRHSLNLSLSGSAAFGEAFVAAFPEAEET